MSNTNPELLRLSNVRQTESLKCGSYGPLFISIWSAQANEEMARQAGLAMRGIAKERGRIYVLSVLGAETPPPETHVRNMIASTFDELEPHIAAVANVIEGQGFRAAALRGVLIGMGMMMRRSRPEKVSATVEDAALFISGQSDRQLASQGIVRAIEQLRALP